MLLKNLKSNTVDAIHAMGLVFGDIGTSPIYTLGVVFLTVSPSAPNILGILSLVIWTLILVVTLQYAVLAMSLSKRGEGGSIVLGEILKKLLKAGPGVAFFSLLTYLGVSFLIGDSIITPAISLLSAIEGLKFLAPQELSQKIILALTVLVALALFGTQKNGATKISGAFGPIMVLWFLSLGAFGLMFIIQVPGVFGAFNPLCGLKFLTENGLAGFFILSQVILCATGAEALYADMGHLGKKPILRAWVFVFFALILNYLGQGAFLITQGGAKNVLFEMVLSANKFLYTPFLALSILAVIIASQAMISGLFSVIFQALNTRILPLLKVDYTSEKIPSQIYIPFVNWVLGVLVIFVILFFKESSHLANAYGFTVTGTILITAVLMSAIFILKNKPFKAALALGLCTIDLAFFIAVCSKIKTGAYLPLTVAALAFSLILLYIKGNKALYHAMHFMSKKVFEAKYEAAYEKSPKIQGTALYFVRTIEHIAPYIVQTMFQNGIIYEQSIFVHITHAPSAFGVSWELTHEIAHGLRVLKIEVGYLEKLDIEQILSNLKINEKALFYGVEEVQTKNPFYHIYALIKKITPTHISFYNFPKNKAHGVICEVEL